MQRHDVASTLSWRFINVMCPLGCFKWYTWSSAKTIDVNILTKHNILSILSHVQLRFNILLFSLISSVILSTTTCTHRFEIFSSVYFQVFYAQSTNSTGLCESMLPRKTCSSRFSSKRSSFYYYVFLHDSKYCLKAAIYCMLYVCM